MSNFLAKSSKLFFIFFKSRPSLEYRNSKFFVEIIWSVRKYFKLIKPSYLIFFRMLYLFATNKSLLYEQGKLLPIIERRLFDLVDFYSTHFQERKWNF